MKMLVLSCALLLPLTASAQTMSIHIDAGGGLVRYHDVLPSSQFDVVTKVDLNGEDLRGVEWVQTAVEVVAPGVFKLTETLLCPIIILDLDLRVPGEYVFGCPCATGAPDLELARIGYGAFGGPVPMDTVLQIRGFQPGDSVPSTFGGEPGFVDCDDNLVPAPMGGSEALITGSGVVVPPGASVLNPTPPEPIIPNEKLSFTQVKGRYR